MGTKYLQLFPKPLLDDLIFGRWLPVIGSGFSRNAIVPAGKQMPLWSDLGSIFAAELKDYDPSGALDAISAYEHEYGRPKLIERLTEELLISESRPGSAHRAFCEIPFNIVCTTNFDFLLERQYEADQRICTPLIDEEQLSINVNAQDVGLLKLHGDLRHPARLVATETDYDKFLDKYPMLATYLANLLIIRTAVLVGYSLDDPDFRQIWQIVGERLGRSRRMAYAIIVGASSTEVSRFDRRGVKVINLPIGRLKHGEVLSETFLELRDYLRETVIPSSQFKEEQSLQELSLPADAQTRLCFFAVPLALLSFYRDRVFPLVRQNGFVPVTADDIVAPGDTILPKIDALIGRALLMIVDASSEFTLAEFRIGIRRLDASRILFITQKGFMQGMDFSTYKYLERPDINTVDPESFLDKIQEWLKSIAKDLRPSLLAEPNRLLGLGEYRAAVISAISLLESVLRRHVKLSSEASPRGVAFRDLLEHAKLQGILGKISVEMMHGWLKVRNEAVHSDRTVNKLMAEQIVKGVQATIQPYF